MKSVSGESRPKRNVLLFVGATEGGVVTFELASPLHEGVTRVASSDVSVDEKLGARYNSPLEMSR